MSEALFPKVGVIGAGTMGNGIAQVFASTGSEVTLVDLDQAARSGCSLSQPRLQSGFGVCTLDQELNPG